MFNIRMLFDMLKSRKMLIFNITRGTAVKIYDFNGKKNLSGDRIRAARMQVQGIIIERDSISRIEIGTRFIPDYELPVFSNVLGVSVAWLLGMED